MVECNSPLFKPGIHTVISFQIKQYRKEEKNSKFTMENITLDDQGQFPQCKFMLIVCTLDMIYNKIALLCLWSSFQNHLATVSLWEKHQTNLTERHSTKYLTSTPENCQGHKKTRNVWETVTDRGASGDITTKCNGVYWIGS